MPIDGLHDRLREAFGNRPAREIGEIIGVNPEIVRRVLSGHQPTTEFVLAVCSRMDISADWLLIGRGPARASDVRIDALTRIPAVDLLGSLSVSLRRMLEAAPATDAASPNDSHEA